MELQKLAFTPGINKETTRYANGGGWYDCDKVRFRNGLPEKIGGWAKLTTSVFDGNCRHLYRFRTLAGELYTVVGTNTRWYLENGGDLYELTPWTDRDTSLTNPFTTVNTEDTVEVNKVSHGRVVGDRIEITGSTAVNGIAADDINGVREIAEIVDADNYKFTAGAAATSSGTGGGSSVDIYYLLTEGLDEQIMGTGWGSDSWGEGAWGEPGSSVVASGNIRTWSSDSFGEDVLTVAWDTGVFYWDATNGVATTPSSRPIPLSEVAGASGTPTVGRIAMVSSRDRHAIVFACDSLASPGTQDPLLIRWADQENIAEWTPGTTNTSGSLLISSGSEIIAAKQTRQEILVWTDVDMHSMQYVGGDSIFGINQIARGTSIIGRNAATVHLGVAYWMGDSGFYVYDGQVREMNCTIEDFVFRDINLDQTSKVYAGVNANEGEIIWFYPSSSSEDNDRYVIYSVRDDVWYHGTMERTAWIDRKLSDNPIAASTDFFLYYHEFGNLDGSTSPESQIVAHIESSPMEIGNGDSFMFIKRLIPDITFRSSAAGLNPSVDMTLKVFRNPGNTLNDSNVGAVARSATSPVEQFTKDVWMRLRGRSVVYRVEDTATSSDEKDSSWRLGMPRIEMRTDGRK